MAQAPDFSARRAALCPEARAFTDHGTGRIWTFADIEREAQALAGWFAAFEPGARIGHLAYNRAESFVALFAARKAGVVLCPLNWRAPVAELRGVTQAIGISALVHDAAHDSTARALLPAAPRLAMRAEGGFGLPAGGGDACAMDEDACWYLLSTSGTTGAPKAVIQTPRMAQAVAVNLAQGLGLVPEDSGLCHLPVFHTAGINLFALPLFQWGGHSHILPRHDLGQMAALIAAGEISQLFAVPTVWQALLGHPGVGDLGLARLRGVVSGGAALSPDLVAGFARHGAVLRNGFGMTETGPTGFLLDKAAVAMRPGSIGKPQINTEARLAGVADGTPGEGELLLRGATVTPGYFGDPAATANAFDQGWLKTGDRAARDEAGYYRLIDRLKDMFVSGGENVWPAEVELVLASHPAIAEAAVTAILDPRWGEVGRAHLRLAVPASAADGATTAPWPGAAALRDWCRERLSPFKIPKDFVLVEDFPRTASGKIRKHLLPR